MLELSSHDPSDEEVMEVRKSEALNNFFKMLNICTICAMPCHVKDIVDFNILCCLISFVSLSFELSADVHVLRAKVQKHYKEEPSQK